MVDKSKSPPSMLSLERISPVPGLHYCISVANSTDVFGHLTGHLHVTYHL